MKRRCEEVKNDYLGLTSVQEYFHVDGKKVLARYERNLAAIENRRGNNQRRENALLRLYDEFSSSMNIYGDFPARR